MSLNLIPAVLVKLCHLDLSKHSRNAIFITGIVLSANCFTNNIKSCRQLLAYVVHLRDRLLSCQLCGADAPRFPPGGEGMHLMEPYGSGWVLFAKRGEWLGQVRVSCCWDCLSQSEAFPPLRPGCSNVKPSA